MFETAYIFHVKKQDLFILFSILFTFLHSVYMLPAYAETCYMHWNLFHICWNFFHIWPAAAGGTGGVYQTRNRTGIKSVITRKHKKGLKKSPKNKKGTVV